MSAAGLRAQGRVLIIAGSDSGGGAGIQADIKTVTALGGYAASAITALTAQNTLGVFGVHGVPPAFVRQQIEVVLSDIGADTVKTGMLGDSVTVEVVAEALAAYRELPLIVDPVMVAKGGASLLTQEAVGAVMALLVPRARVLTPNAPEAACLTGLPVENLAEQKRAADVLLRAGAGAVLIKGGHIAGPVICDVLADGTATHVFESARLDVRATHGTGCTLASAIAALLAQDVPLWDAVARARGYVLEAMRRAPGFGGGHSPLDHGWLLRQGDDPA